MSEKLPHHNLRFDEARFWQLLSASVALTADQKQSIVNNIPKYTQRQIDHLMRVLADEQRGLQQFANQEIIENMRYASAKEWQGTIDSRRRGHEENFIQSQLHVLLNYRRNVLVVGKDVERLRHYLKPLAQKRRYRLCYLIKPKLLVEQLRHGFYDAVVLQDDNHNSLSKGLISEYNANLAGMLLLAKFKAAYLRRINLPREQRPPYHLYVDEFHNFCSMSFAAMLAESQQYGITVTLANQFLSQLNFTRWGVASKTVDALLGNVGNLITFRVGVKDAQIFEGEYGGMVPTNSITALKNWTAFAKILVNGQTTRPFTIKTVPFRGEENRSALEYIKRQSELKYGYNSSLEDRLTDFTKLVERL